MVGARVRRPQVAYARARGLSASVSARTPCYPPDSVHAFLPNAKLVDTG